MKILFFVLSITFIVSCYSKTSTPNQYKYGSYISKADYTLDSTRIMKKLIYMLGKNISPFSSTKQFDSSTSIFLDSIIYNPDKSKMIIFIISKNNNSKLDQPVNYKTKFHYNANYLYCIRSVNDIKISNYSSFNLSHWETYEDVKARLKEECFENRTQEGIQNKEPIYNIDDKRFWQSKDYNDIIAEKYDYKNY
jgi:hypothetical protein